MMEQIFLKKKYYLSLQKIGLDHTAILGDTLEKIAYEKGGIIQENDNVLIYPASKGVVNVIKDICEEKNASLSILSEKDIVVKKVKARGNEFSYKGVDYSTKMVGAHQNF